MIKNELPKTELRLSDFYYDLPKEMIAQTPVEPRDSSRLMLLDKHTGEIEHKIFRDIADYINPEDLCCWTSTRVKSNTKYSVISPTI